MSVPYVHVEFPKWLYRGETKTPDGCLVQNLDEETLFRKDGWKTAEEFYVEQSVSESAKLEIPKKKEKK